MKNQHAEPGKEPSVLICPFSGPIFLTKSFVDVIFPLGSFLTHLYAQ